MRVDCPNPDSVLPTQSGAEETHRQGDSIPESGLRSLVHGRRMIGHRSAETGDRARQRDDPDPSPSAQ
ncbi:hypothetical protein ElP_72970 (plasmid) [Tautonia plasticadhaerens]|uniref:Uncharacterized protein n=1 Tax=Tautonia plasticadhaerens TaxID=2527974 RepID=A0A518HES5_9BACT|nr:hypothetical protein ElP_72970 [Tautonia plasticadhaerens]